MTLAGLLLMFAAVMKFHEMLTICVPSWQTNKLGFWESYEFLLIQIPLEFALGVWMVSGLFRKAAWIAGTLAYFGFIFVTIFKVVTGAESCGCFGQIHLDPKITLFAMDIPMFLLLAIFRPKGYKLLPPPWPNMFYLLAVAVPTIGLMVLAAPAMVTFRPNCIKPQEVSSTEAQLRLELYKVKQELAARQQESDQHKHQVESLQQQLEALKQSAATPVVPETNNKTAPEPKAAEKTQDSQAVESLPVSENLWEWLGYVVEDDVRAQISRGLTVVMMHRYDCPVCEDMVPRYSDYYRQMTEQDSAEFKIAFLAIPPYGDKDHVPEDTTCISGKLTDTQKWEITSPYVVALLDGELVKTWPQGTAPEPEKILDEVFGN